MISGVMIFSMFIIFIIIGITVVVTVKAYSVTRKETIDPLPKDQAEEHITESYR